MLNKNPIMNTMGQTLYLYLLQHTREPPVLRQLREETSTISGANMQITPEQGQFMGFLVETLGVQRAIEIGVYTGYSSLAVAMALPADGRLEALDRDERTMALARKYWHLAGVSHKVRAHVAPALDTLQRLLDEGGEGTYDFVFIDADKSAYQQYFEYALRLLRRGGVVAVDNVLWYGKVADPQNDDKPTLALRSFNTSLLADERVTISIVPVGDGMALCRKR